MSYKKIRKDLSIFQNNQSESDEDEEFIHKINKPQSEMDKLYQEMKVIK